MRATALALAGLLGLLPEVNAQEGPAGPADDDHLPIRIEEIRRLVLEARRKAEQEAARERAASGDDASEAPAPGLRLGAYGRPSSPREFESFLMTPEGPRFETYVEVYGRTHQERIEEILRAADLLRGATPRGAPTLQEMAEYRSTTQNVNFLPAIDWLVDQVKKKLKK
jgi:hypothetical protein